LVSAPNDATGQDEYCSHPPSLVAHSNLRTDPVRDFHSSSAPPMREATISVELFAWQNEAIVLLAERAGDHWVIARGWRTGDALRDVRCWTFASPRTFAGQVRRLIADATGDHRHAAEMSAAALTWAGDHV